MPDFDDSETDDEADTDDYPDSGPFCRHWGDPGDCDEKCVACGHICAVHDYYDDACKEEGCLCTFFLKDT